MIYKLKKNYNDGKAYAQSKLANILFTNELAKRYEKDGITSYSLHPGAIYTELTRAWETNFIAKLFFKYVFSLFVKNPVDGA